MRRHAGAHSIVGILIGRPMGWYGCGGLVFDWEDSHTVTVMTMTLAYGLENSGPHDKSGNGEWYARILVL